MPNAPEFTDHVIHGKPGGHAYTFVDDDTWRIEHCQAGRWGSCSLLIFAERDDPRAIQRAVIRHLARQPHPFEHPQQLAGIAHAGGGEKIDGHYVKGPRRG